MTEKSQSALIKIFSSKGKGKSAEADWARFFLKLGLDFEYEPTLFEFANGMGFCPDFYFPEHKTYVEVTVTHHIGRKNKKIRLARESHPDTTFILLTRHEHRFVFGDLDNNHFDHRRINAWGHVAENLRRLFNLTNGLAQPLTSLGTPVTL